VSKEGSSGGSSYGQILKSSSIIGGAQLINQVIGLVRMKVVAVLLGPAGVGLVGLYVSTIGLVGTVTKLGLGESGVRDIAAASSEDADSRQRLGQTAATLSRLCWYSGIAGWLLTAIFAWPLSRWIFESEAYAASIAILGGVVLIESLSSNYNALLRGLRRIVDLGKVQVISALVSTALALLVYWRLGERGIIPVIFITALVTLGVTWLYARRLDLPHTPLSSASFAGISRSLLRLGLLFTFVTVLGSIVGLGIRAIIVRQLGLEASGFYQAASTLTALLGGLMIQAMATDLYPRLTANIRDSVHVAKLVNEQIQTGMLIATPVLCILLCFRELAMTTLYSKAFQPAVALMPWFLAGVFLQVMIVPMEFVARAKAHVRWLSITQSATHLSQLLVVAVLTAPLGLIAAGYACMVAFVVQLVLSYAAASAISGFRFELATFWKMLIGSGLFLAPFATDFIGSSALALAAKMLLVALACWWSASQMAALLGGWAYIAGRLRRP